MLNFEPDKKDLFFLKKFLDFPGKNMPYYYWKECNLKQIEILHKENYLKFSAIKDNFDLHLTDRGLKVLYFYGVISNRQ